MPSCNTYHLTWVSLTLAWVSLHGCCNKAQPLFLTLDKGYLLTAAIPDLQRGMAPLGPPVPVQPPLLRLLVPAAGPGLGPGVAPQGHRPWPWARGGFSWPPRISDAGFLLPAATGLGRGVAPPGCRPDLGTGCLLPAAPDLGLRVALLGCSCAVTACHSRPLPRPRTWSISSWPRLMSWPTDT